MNIINNKDRSFNQNEKNEKKKYNLGQMTKNEFSNHLIHHYPDQKQDNEKRQKYFNSCLRLIISSVKTNSKSNVK